MQMQSILNTPRGQQTPVQELKNQLVKQLNTWLHLLRLDTRYLFTGCHFFYIFLERRMQYGKDNSDRA